MSAITGLKGRQRVRQAIHEAALVEIRRARFRRSVLHVNELAQRLKREYPDGGISAEELRADVALLAARERVPLAFD